ncbi:ABC transporter permease [Parendozoicomonas haliclonae]|uniref:Dipeptide transport system permease protein DppC n=1 Tax=Parendozoicomonas haliclonae TaxID=1960125 RepID=A0A1X7AG86_9GAMM|nr:ABC transporter permease [Parendozoicomonas haliclonae]SMA38167.1 Dipeptide transport system permease protein DppC [Parendozoicomonas haliclonae]
MDIFTVKPVILWTDLMLWLLVISITAFLFSLRSNPESRDQWRQVFSSRLGMATFIIILSYITLALIDSLHFRKPLPPAAGQNPETTYYSNKVHSVLDLILGEMGERKERSYSEPFALKSFTKENMTNEQGQTYRDYPDLEHAGSHLENKAEHHRDLLWQSLIGLTKGLLFGVILCALMKGTTRSSSLPWGTAMTTILVICMLLGWLLHVGNLYHILGTDRAGNDTLYDSIKGIRTGVLIGTLATLIMMPIAITLGICAGYFKGWVDDTVQYLYTTLSSIPGILLIAAAILQFQVFIDLNPGFFEVGLEKADARFLGLCFILGITSWAGLCRLLRAETLKISQLPYVQAAHAFGVSHIRVIRQHILPNVMHIILITFVLDFSGLVLAEAVLSYIGVGVDSSMPSWGNMINLARSELSQEPVVWWNLVGAFFFMFTLVLAANLFSDLVNEAFNPKNRQERAQ